jgi:hypothetical protein
MQKDFLFLNYSWVWGSTTYFNYFREKGHTIDIFNETNLPTHLEHTYKNVVLYLHEGSTIPITNHLLNNYLKDSFLIQHDDTDEEQIQVWSNRKPDLYMQRELTKDTIINSNTPVIPFHFPMKSIFDEKLNEEKIYDVSFVANMTNQRRWKFVDYIIELSKNELSHLNWYIDVKGADYTPGHATENFKSVTNKSKIGLHYFGNSYDSTRIWEILSCKTALLMPKMRNLSVSDDFMPLKNYTVFNDDMSDLKDKILELLDSDNYIKKAEEGFNEYNSYHNVEKSCEYYYNQIMKYCKK